MLETFYLEAARRGSAFGRPLQVLRVRGVADDWEKQLLLTVRCAFVAKNSGELAKSWRDFSWGTFAPCQYTGSQVCRFDLMLQPEF